MSILRAALLTSATLLLVPSPSSGQDDSLRLRSHIVLVGDSTVTDGAGWGETFAALLSDDIKCTNLSKGGCSSSSFRQERLWDAALSLKPDWVLIQFGHNDEPGHSGKENEPNEGYRENILRYINEAKSAGIKPALVTPISRRQWGKDPDTRDRIVSSLRPYAAVLRELSKQENVPLINLHDKSIVIYQSLGRDGCKAISPEKENGKLDGTHLNKLGSILFGSVVAAECRTRISAMEGFFPTSKLMQLQQRYPPELLTDPTPVETRKPATLTSKGPTTIIVARDGTGDFRTLTDAVAAAPSGNSDRTTIEIRPGVYMGQVIVPADKPNLTFLGAGDGTSIITYALTVHDPIPPGVGQRLKGYSVVVLADDFEARGLTFRQEAGDHGQAIALRLDGDRAQVLDCRLIGWQDTLRIEGDSHYFKDCYIEGRVDYIYGGASALFENCTLHTKLNGYVTAASTPQDKSWGFVFKNCRLTGTKKRSTYLGRPWRPYASVTFINCHMGECIRPEGWDNWRNPANEKTARYAEYGSSGPGEANDQRVNWSHQLTVAEAERVSAEAFSGKDHRQ